LNALSVLRNRSAAVTAGLLGILDDLDGIELVRPVSPATSPIGLTLWHIPRAQDWLVQGSVRGVAEVAEGFRDGLPDPDAFGFGTGLVGDRAQVAASAVRLEQLRAYAVAVRDEVDAWLAGLSEEDLDAVPPFAARQHARSAYVTPEALADVEGLDGLSVAMLLMRPATTHVFRHLGEVETLISIARARGA
jgi:DinB superfamily